MPSSSGTRKSWNVPASRVPRKTLRTASVVAIAPSDLALDDPLEFVGYGRDRLPADRHPRAVPPHHDVDRPELLVGVRVLDARVRAAALAPLERGARHRLAHREEVLQVDRRVPAGIVLAVPFDADPGGARPELVELGERRLEVVG